MSVLLEYSPWLAAMAGLILMSAFFSSSEAALFYLDRADRRRLASGRRAQRAAASLLADTDRLLTAILFWNLAVNIAIFTISSILSLRLERAGRSAEAGTLAAASLVAVILLGEMLPKSVAVAQPRTFAALVSLPLSALIRLVDPLLPALRMASVLSRRVLWPSFVREPYLAVSDLERAVELSTANAALLEQEQVALQGIVSLSTLRAEEVMRPRTQLMLFRPPVSLADLGGRLTPSGYLLVTEPDSDEVAAAVSLADLWEVPGEHLERLARPILFVPWCATVAQAWETMRRDGQRVAGVVNEYGETVGALTYEDILDAIFSPTFSRSERLLKQGAIRLSTPDAWHVSGMTTVRRLQRYFSLAALPESKSVTLGGVIQEQLGRLPRVGDQCRWGPFRMRVLQVGRRRQIVVELTRVDRPEEVRP